MKLYDTIIIGGGPSGMAAAMECIEDGQRVLLVDRLEKLGKKILVTGNGRCNLTNLVQTKACYRSQESEKAWTLIQKYGLEDTFAMFHKLGILTKDKDGYVYPYNEQASSVRDAFEAYIMAHPNVEVRLESDVSYITMDKKGHYVIGIGNVKYGAWNLVIATGGLVGKKLGCDGIGYTFAKGFGHQIVPPVPALTALKSGAPFLKKLSGVRNKSRISLYIDGDLSAEETGELQWADYGISGVAIFQLSRFAIRALEKGSQVHLSLDLVPDYEEAALKAMLEAYAKQGPYKNGEVLVKGILPAKLAPVVVKEARIDQSKTALQAAEIDKLVKVMKGFVLRINGYMGYDKAQVTSGGVSLAELRDDLESIYAEGLYFVGEVVDVDGTCGGYNLQWAFSSGRAAGRSIGMKRRQG